MGASDEKRNPISFRTVMKVDTYTPYSVFGVQHSESDLASHWVTADRQTP